ncbi:hypothetical protein LOTGIDRAFT_231046 [Lottia gigantea]|uniref:Uncharacterized shell protein 16 n=2 Tax=Lottia gigantea TaxID=225164 RepID=USP16_LOTGI|nr:hypothetical protein LOTGIDRAFT_231046 [Lottia gigantea]B3A0R5.1 RecName: Full=Uncharacterized shell protein 16; Short=LUSP-16; Flags: Precursor [Lottia gigantea]ESO99352.1 hypothetical protein LOTGIDRAFT_231046 [Lottia gigantea]
MWCFIVFLTIFLPTLEGQYGPAVTGPSLPEELCTKDPQVSRGRFYRLKVRPSFYRRAHPLQVELYQTIHAYGPIIADAYVHVPETAKNSSTAALGIKTLGYWLPKNPDNYKISRALSCYNSVWGNDAIVANSDRELKFNLTGIWYPPTSEFDLIKRPFVKIVAYVTPDPDVRRRRWYRAESQPIRNLDYIAFQHHMRRYKAQMKAFRTQLEMFN